MRRHLKYIIGQKYFENPGRFQTKINQIDKIQYKVYNVITMNCPNVRECICPKVSCPNHGRCCDCVKKHRETDSLPYCLFPDNGGDKSNENHYRVLKKRFEGAEESCRKR